MMQGRTDAWQAVAVSGAAVSSLYGAGGELQRSRIKSFVDTHEAVDLVFNGGTSDIIGGDNIPVLSQDITDYVTGLRALGIRRITWSTITPATSFTGPQEAVRVGVNNFIKTSGLFDGVVDLTSDATLENPASAYYADGTHHTIAGAQAIAALMGPVVLPMLT